MKRRGFLATGAVLGAAHVAGRGTAEEPRPAAVQDALGQRVAFEGAHQAGVLTPQPRQALFVAFGAIAPGRAELAEAVRTLSERARRLTAEHLALLGAPGEGPTPDSGVLGARVAPDALTLTVGVGASLFAPGRYGLAHRRPVGLQSMPAFPDDALIASETHGDVLVQLCAGTQETLLNALRDLMRATRGALAVRWKVEGFVPVRREPGAGRNLLGFKDGTGNPRSTDAALMDRLLWTPERGTFATVRIIRNRVEFWDRVALSEQELLIGRDKATGAKLAPVPADAHIRLARPGTPGTEGQRILRRGYNYSRGVDDAGQLDMGLIFVAFCRDLQGQFEAIQKRLAGEGLADYVEPTGGGYFYLPPGARGGDDWVGSGLLG